MFRLKEIPNHRFWAVMALLCPIIAGVLSWMIINSDTDFWTDVNKDLSDDANRNAVAIMAAAEGIEILFFVAVGSIVGLFFAALSLAFRRTKLGFFSLALNASPFVLFVLMRVWY